MVTNVENVLLSRRYELFRRMQGKLLIEDEQASTFPPAVNRLLVPTLDITDLLLDIGAQTANADLSPAAGTYVPMHTTPAGERWHMTWVVREASTSITHIEFNYAVPNINFQVVGDSSLVQFFSLSIFKMNVGDSIGMLTNADAGDTSIALSILFERELLD